MSNNPVDTWIEHPELELAATTWTGEWWTRGGGGNAWDAFAYDPEADLLYIGTGNGGPWNRDLRSPDGGDNLFLSSILAVRPDSGELAEWILHDRLPVRLQLQIHKYVWGADVRGV
jgi:glucose dehydrogenase